MKLLCCSWSKVLPLAACTVALHLAAPVGLADPAHAPAAGATPSVHGADAPITINFNSVGEAWAVIQASVLQLQELTAGKALKEIHGVEERVAAALKYLQANSAMVTGDKQKRLASALTQASAISANVHAASDAGDQAKTEAEVKKLQSVMKLVGVQYPADALKAPAGFVTYQCPMKDFTGDKPGNCPECGMKMKPTFADIADHGGHQHGSAEPTMTLAVTSAKPLTVGEKTEVTVVLKKKDGTPVSLEDLKEAHTERIHLLVIDPSLTDYHHEHPVAGARPGEFVFSFTPRKPGSYRVWADLLPVATGQQEYVVGDLAAATKPEPITNRTESFIAKVEGFTYTLSFKGALKAGDATLGTLTVTDPQGKIFPSLEPLMGAYAHIVGFSEDYKTIAHIHPMGEEPTKATDRGAGKLDFHLLPEKTGMLRLFAQVQIGGVSKFAPFTLNIPAANAKPAAQTAHAGH